MEGEIKIYITLHGHTAVTQNLFEIENDPPEERKDPATAGRSRFSYICGNIIANSVKPKTKKLHHNILLYIGKIAAFRDDTKSI
jgi:hypothetical protein